MSCVGFCINVILGFIEEEQYYNYTDWTVATLPESYLGFYKNEFERKFPEQALDTMLMGLRRIRPSEYFCSGFIKSIPVRKADVDAIINDVETVL